MSVSSCTKSRNLKFKYYFEKVIIHFWAWQQYKKIQAQIIPSRLPKTITTTNIEILELKVSIPHTQLHDINGARELKKEYIYTIKKNEEYITVLALSQTRYFCYRIELPFTVAKKINGYLNQNSRHIFLGFPGSFPLQFHAFLYNVISYQNHVGLLKSLESFDFVN